MIHGDVVSVRKYKPKWVAGLNIFNNIYSRHKFERKKKGKSFPPAVTTFKFLLRLPNIYT